MLLSTIYCAIRILFAYKPCVCGGANMCLVPRVKP